MSLALQRPPLHGPRRLSAQREPVLTTAFGGPQSCPKIGENVDSIAASAVAQTPVPAMNGLCYRSTVSYISGGSHASPRGVISSVFG